MLICSDDDGECSCKDDAPFADMVKVDRKLKRHACNGELVSMAVTCLQHCVDLGSHTK